MDAPAPAPAEFSELRGLVERIRRGDCVLVLGPRASFRPGDPDRKPLDECLAAELVAAVGGNTSPGRLSLGHAADLFYRDRQDRDELELAVREFFEREGVTTTDFHRDLAKLPFKLCVSASPDNLMVTAFKEAGKLPQMGYYSFRPLNSPRLASPTAERPLVYSLFGHHNEPSSLVLTEGDLIEFLVAIVKGVPAVPDQVRSILADPDASFLFLGFGFHNWYLRVLLHVLKAYGHVNKSFAFEDKQFFEHPDREQAVGFFSNRRIDFRPIRWELLASHLRQKYEEVAPRTAGTAGEPAAAAPDDAPKVFLCYASEDRVQVDALGDALEGRGIRVWQDARQLRAGDNWARQLMQVIEKQVHYVVVVQSIAMTTAAEGWFRLEIDAALQRDRMMGERNGQRFRFLIPVRLGECDCLSALEDHHVIDVSDSAGLDLLATSIMEDWQRRTPLRRVRSEEVA